jgi:hypothetical protein
MMDMYAMQESVLPLVLIVALVFVILRTSLGSHKKNEVTIKGWQKNRKKSNRSKKPKKVQSTQKKVLAKIVEESKVEAPIDDVQAHTEIIVHEESKVEAPLYDVEAPSSPLLQISSNPIETCPLDGHYELMSQVENGGYEESSEANSSCEEVCEGSDATFNIEEERDLPVHEYEIEVHSGSSEFDSSCEQSCKEIEAAYPQNVFEERDNIEIQMPKSDRGTDRELEDTCEACANSDEYSWGCARHRTYTSALLLAHRELRFGAEQNPINLNLRLVSRNGRFA